MGKTTTKKPKQHALKTRGRVFTGVVVSDKSQKTVTVEWERKKFIPKYERFEKRRTRVRAHNPTEISAKESDIVKIAETRPISKTKKFIVIEKIGESLGHKIEKAEEVIEEKGTKEIKAEKKKENLKNVGKSKKQENESNKK